MDRFRQSHPAELTRWQFGLLSARKGLAMLLREAGTAALEVVGRDVDVQTPDGKADAHFVHPASREYPGVLIWPDAFGLRPAMKQIGRRLAESGYAVLVVNPYYRIGRAPLPLEGSDFNDEKTHNEMMSMMASLTPERQATDATAFVDYLGAQPAVDPDRKMGTIGYCMGGPITVRTAAARADRIGAGASFHGGRLVTDEPDSPHLLVPKLNAHYLFAIAQNDDEAEPETKKVLRDAFAKREVPAEIEVYEGALHGWCPPDMPVYHEAQAERAWSRLLVLFEGAL